MEMDKYKNFSQLDLVLMAVACEEGGNLKLLKELEDALAKKEKEGGKEECRHLQEIRSEI